MEEWLYKYQFSTERGRKEKKVSTLDLFIIREERKALPGFQFSVIIPYNNKVKFQWFLWHLFPSLTYHKRLTFSTLYAISQSLALNLNDEKIKKIAGSVRVSVPTDAYKMVYRYCSSQVMTVQQTIKSYNSAELRGLKLILKVPDVVQPMVM